MSKKYGICYLCGKYDELTFEHIPPKGANNKDKAKILTGEELFNVAKIKSGQKLKYINRQQGVGNYTLCKECNNNTGSWYADEYINFANSIGYVLTNEIKSNDTKTLKLNFKNLYFQKIIKQILCMFVSTIQPYNSYLIEDMKKYIMDVNENNFNKDKYRISMFLLKKYEIGYSGLIDVFVVEDGKIVRKKVAFLNAYPMGFILEVNPNGKIMEDTTDITSFTDLKYNEHPDVSIIVPLIDKYTLGNFTKKIVDDLRTGKL